MLSGLVEQKSVSLSAPTYPEVHRYLASCFPGAELYASAFYNAMAGQHWQDRQRRPITNWRAVAKAYASAAHRKHL